MNIKLIVILGSIAAVVVLYLLIFHNRDGIVPFKPHTVPAQGTVLVGGKPAAGVRVTYHPQFDVGVVKFTPNGTTNSKGQFILSSGKPGDGAPPGEYIVTFDYPTVTSEGIEEEIDLFEGKYSSPAASKWRVSVQENSQASFRLDGEWAFLMENDE